MDKKKVKRPQDRHLIPLTERSPEEARAIRSAGGKARAEQQRQRKQLAEMLEIISELPLTDKRVINRLKRMGLTEEDGLTQKMLIADTLVKACQVGNIYAVQLYLALMGEGGAKTAENNLIEALKESTKEDIDYSDLPEVQQAAAAGDDVVE